VAGRLFLQFLRQLVKSLFPPTDNNLIRESFFEFLLYPLVKPLLSATLYRFPALIGKPPGNRLAKAAGATSN
jgi:hypothetical protein